MDEKKLGFAMMVPAVWLASVLYLVVFTLASPILFVVAWISPYSGPQDFIESIFGDIFE